ncbi:hypothetical protein P691DRAFT_253434 [Macrolepiota fuliginosa MF-IS2]|uniref:Uncharacterized protein n=1 Tax=Macrolepiota fuliginosa MF-IS2 TaxID=1400762 RepID=A0A9P5X9D5_9AGAR|nr:hypothetical protein P691DRAFT_253434 [Macrolepiota fuliginosa MF-IS2]
MYLIHSQPITPFPSAEVPLLPTTRNYFRYFNVQRLRSQHSLHHFIEFNTTVTSVIFIPGQPYYWLFRMYSYYFGLIIATGSVVTQYVATTHSPSTNTNPRH